MKTSPIKKVGLSDSGPPSGTITRRFLESKDQPSITNIPYDPLKGKSDKTAKAKPATLAYRLRLGYGSTRKADPGTKKEAGAKEGWIMNQPAQQPKRFYSPLMTAIVRSGKFANLSGPAVKFLTILETHCNDKWECFLSDETVMREGGKGLSSPATVVRARKEVRESGLMETKGGKGKECTRYRLILPQGCTSENEVPSISCTSNNEGQDQRSTSNSSPSHFTSCSEQAVSTSKSEVKQYRREQEYEQDISTEQSEGLFPDIDHGTGKKTKGRSNPDVRLFINWFSEWYQTEFTTKYIVQWGRDGKLIKELLETLSLDELKAAAANMAKDQYWRPMASIQILYGQINTFNKKETGKFNDSKSQIGNRQFEAANRQPGKFDAKPRAVIRV